MRALSRAVITTAAAALLVCAADAPHHVRATGMIRAVHSQTVLVPRIEGVGGNQTLAAVAENGAMVAPGDTLAMFDRANETRLLQDAQSKYDDLLHQIEQKKAMNNSNAEKRVADLQQAQADLKKAEIESRKGPVLSAIDQEKNQVKLDDAKAHVASLQRSGRFRELSETAQLRDLELQRDRQAVAVARQTRNMDRLTVKSPIRGMVALENMWRNNSMGHAQEGDQIWPGTPLLRIFGPGSMAVEVSVGEPDGAVLVPGATAVVHPDAFPNLALKAHFESASPVATAPLGTTMKTFSARFIIDQSDPRLLPDLSAAVDIEPPAKNITASAAHPARASR